MFCSDTPSDVVIVSGISVLLTAIEKRFLTELLDAFTVCDTVRVPLLAKCEVAHIGMELITST